MRLIFFLLLISALSCSSDHNDNKFNNAVGFEMIVKDEAGTDLLNPNAPNSLNTEDIKLYYLVNGMIEEMYDPNLNAPRNYMIFQHTDGLYRIRVFPNQIQSEPFPITYLKWNESATDTIKCQYEYADNSVALLKVWFNEDIKLNVEEGNGLTFEIVK